MFKSELKEEVIQLFEDDRRLRNVRFNEVYNLIETNKQLQQELIVQQFESQKALMKAMINKETAERMLADEDLLLNVNTLVKKSQASASFEQRGNNEEIEQQIHELK